MKTLVAVVFFISAFLLISAGDANANGYYYPRSHGCYPSYGFSFGFYGGYGGYYPYNNYYPQYGYRPYYGHYRSPYYGGYGYYGRPNYYGGYGYYGRSNYYGGYGYRGGHSSYNRPYSYRSNRHYPRIQKPHSSQYNGSRVVRRR